MTVEELYDLLGEQIILGNHSAEVEISIPAPYMDYDLFAPVEVYPHYNVVRIGAVG